jgi:hypothetical protein
MMGIAPRNTGFSNLIPQFPKMSNIPAAVVLDVFLGEAVQADRGGVEDVEPPAEALAGSAIVATGAPGPPLSGVGFHATFVVSD